MRKIYVFIAIALFLCYCSSNNSDSSSSAGTIYGEVTDKVTGARLSGANVMLLPLGTSNLTGSQGRYEFTNVEAGKYFLSVTKAGYSKLIDDFEINIKANSSISRDVQIEKLPETLRLVSADEKGEEITGLYFGNTTVRSFTIFNASSSTLNWEIINDKEWITINKLTGTIIPGGQESIYVTIDPSQLGDGASIVVTSVNLGSRDLEIAAFPPSSSSQIQSSSSGLGTTLSSSSGGEVSAIEVVTTSEGTVLRGANLSTKLGWLNRNVESHNTYIVEVGANDNTSLYTFQYSGAINVTIVLRSDGANRAIRLGSNGTMFDVKTNVTLVLDNITLQGHSQNTGCVVSVSGGILRMNDETAITGNSNCGVNVSSGSFEMNGGTISSNTSGVYMNNSNSTFTMNGGAISGNSARGVNMSSGSFTMNSGTISGNAGGVYMNYGTFTMKDGTISGNTANSGGGVHVNGGTFNMQGGIITGNIAREYGGGVYKQSGAFTKSDGTITGYNSDQSDGNRVADNSGTLPRRGHAIYVNANARKETTASPEESFSAPSYGTITGNWDD